MSDEAQISEEMNAMFDRNSRDPIVRERAMCIAADCKSRKHYMILLECNKRVNSKSYTAESCHEEMVDLMEAIDKCMGSKGFLAMP